MSQGSGAFSSCMRCEVKSQVPFHPIGSAVAGEALWSPPSTDGCLLGFFAFLSVDLTRHALRSRPHLLAGAVDSSSALP